jgi:hypothetical protein
MPWARNPDRIHGVQAAESVLDAIVDSLTLHGYRLRHEPQIWDIHLHGQLRRINAERGRHLADA